MSKWKDNLYRFIPTHVPARGIASFYDVLTLFRVGRKTADAHALENAGALLQETAIASGAFIENQAELDFIPFGKRSTLASSGCGFIALYNAKRALKETVTVEDAAVLLRALELRGAAWRGRAGIAPGAMVRFLKRQGYKTRCVYGLNREKTERLLSFDTFLVTGFNNAQTLHDHIHTVCVTREKEGFVIHNGYRFERGRYTQSLPFPTLFAAAKHIDPHVPSLPIMITGIRR